MLLLSLKESGLDFRATGSTLSGVVTVLDSDETWEACGDGRIANTTIVSVDEFECVFDEKGIHDVDGDGDR